MVSLYWSTRDEAVDLLLARLATARDDEITIDRSSGYVVIRIGDPSTALVTATASLITQGPLHSAVLTEAPLAQESMWIAVEWRRRYLIEESLLGKFDVGELFELQAVTPHGRSFHIFDPSPRLPLDDGNETDESAPAIWLSTAEPFSCDQIIADPQKFYGDLTNPLVGGANALFAAGQDAARHRGYSSDTILVGRLEEFGFTRDHSNDSVNAGRQRRLISAEAVGFSLSDWSAACTLAERYGVLASLREFEPRVGDWWAAGYSFAVAVVLVGLMDPPVVIPVGSVYQQQQIGSNIQNLAIGTVATVTVPAGAIVPIVLPAFCLNQSFSPPNGPLAPTSLLYSGAVGTQQDVWAEIERRYRGPQ